MNDDNLAVCQHREASSLAAITHPMFFFSTPFRYFDANAVDVDA
jgi:hypothetical protein